MVVKDSLPGDDPFSDMYHLPDYPNPLGSYPPDAVLDTTEAGSPRALQDSTREPSIREASWISGLPQHDAVNASTSSLPEKTGQSQTSSNTRRRRKLLIGAALLAGIGIVAVIVIVCWHAVANRNSKYHGHTALPPSSSETHVVSAPAISTTDPATETTRVIKETHVHTTVGGSTLTAIITTSISTVVTSGYTSLVTIFSATEPVESVGSIAYVTKATTATTIIISTPSPNAPLTTLVETVTQPSSPSTKDVGSESRASRLQESLASSPVAVTPAKPPLVTTRPAPGPRRLSRHESILENISNLTATWSNHRQRRRSTSVESKT